MRNLLLLLPLLLASCGNNKELASDVEAIFGPLKNLSCHASGFSMNSYCSFDYQGIFIKDVQNNSIFKARARLGIAGTLPMVSRFSLGAVGTSHCQNVRAAPAQTPLYSVALVDLNPNNVTWMRIEQNGNHVCLTVARGSERT